MGFNFFLFWMIGFVGFTWLIIRILRGGYLPPDNDDDGGMPLENNLPVYDPPSGSSLDDLLVDRPPKGMLHTPPRSKPHRVK